MREIENRIAVLKAKFPVQPTFEQFCEEWEHMDSLSRSLYETALVCPEIAVAGGRYWATIKPYLLQMGLQPMDPFSLKELAKELTSDA